MLGYRSLFNVDFIGDGLVEEVNARTQQWLASKGYEVVSTDGSFATGSIGRGSELIYSHIADEDGGRLSRTSLSEDLPTGRWTTKITVSAHSDSGAKPWIWVDVDSPLDAATKVGRWAGAPRIVRNLLQDFKCRDRGVLLTTHPIVIRPQQVGELIELLKRPGRRAVSFIAGSDTSLPMKAWRDVIDGLLRQTTGQASGYVLDPSATILFNSVMGNFGVASGMLRTYMPGLEPEDARDAIRHRFITADSIRSQHPGRLRTSLSLRAREVANTALLPPDVRRAQRALESLEFRELPRVSADSLQTHAKDGFRQPRRPSAEPERVFKQNIQAAKFVLEKGSLDDTLRSLVLNALGHKELSKTSIDELERLIGLGLTASASESTWASQLKSKQDEFELGEVEKSELRGLIDDLQLDSAELWEDYSKAVQRAAEAEETTKSLRVLLSNAGLSEQVWATPANWEQPPSPTPSGFNDLVEKISALQNILFTGQADITANLDQHDVLSDWCHKTWTILLALNDYCTLRTKGHTFNGVHGYLEGTPAGHHTYPPGRHARDESESVKTNPKFREPRCLVVPEAVHPDRVVFMGSHFRIAQHGLISPRLHYFDATATIGKVVVGYIGPHLPNTQTN